MTTFKPTPCPGCGAIVGELRCMTGDPDEPAAPGSYLVCGGCAHVLIVTNQGGLREADEFEIITLPAWFHEGLLLAQRRVMLYRAQAN